MTNTINDLEIVELLGANYVDMDDPKRHQKIRDIIGFFSGREDRRYTILKVLSGKTGDRTDILWNWVQLTGEKERLTKELPKEQFTENIQQEIENKYLTKDNIKILKTQLKERTKNESSFQLQNIQKKVGTIEKINKELDNY